jgi:hypothetical protein
MNPYFKRQMFLRNLQLMNLAEEMEHETEPEELALGGLLPDTAREVMDEIGYTNTQVPHLRVNSIPTLSGHSAGGFKTSYILSNLPSSFSGYGILAGTYGDI